MNINKLDSLMCVFCLGHVSDTIDYTTTQYCGQPGSENNCQEYKGITTVREYLAEYGNTLVVA